MRTATRVGAVACSILLPVLVSAAGPASAKGPVSATISGPGVDEPVEVSDAVSEVDTGLWTALGDPDPVLAAPPTNDLGPRHTLTWHVLSGQDETARHETTPIEQHLYLEAAGGPVAYTPPGQPFRDGATVEVWFPMLDRLRDDLAAAGVPLAGDELTAGAGNPAPARSDDPVWPEVVVAGGGLALAGVGAFAYRRARRRVGPLSA